MRQTGASLLAAGSIIASPWILFALVYKTYTFSKTGVFYFWGAPTPIGMFNRIMAYALALTLVLGTTMLATAWTMRIVRRRAWARDMKSGATRD